MKNPYKVQFIKHINEMPQIDHFRPNFQVNYSILTKHEITSMFADFISI